MVRFPLFLLCSGSLLLGNGVVDAASVSLTGENYNGWVYPFLTPQSSIDIVSPSSTIKTPDVIISTPQESPSNSDSGLGDVDSMNLPHIPSLLAGIRQRIKQTQTLLKRMGLQDVAKGRPPPSLYPIEEESPNDSAIVSSSPKPMGQNEGANQAEPPLQADLPPASQPSTAVPPLNSNLNPSNNVGGLVSSSQQQTTLSPITPITESSTAYTLVYSG
ncbi:unnamed protein product [Orchesella dallaii]|uniref:Uncharacterized protein n=1 Tax=Orchesella dallaii TaxID=48710 RepID=A0ABP1S7L3_9HEXA